MTRLQQFSKRVILPAVLLGGLAVAVWQGWSWWSWAIAPPVSAQSGASPKAIQLKIREGASAREIGQDLQTLGLIRSASAWDIWTRWLTFHEPSGGFKAGIYRVSPADSLPAIASKIWTGDVVNLSYTIPEGWNLRDMAAYFEQQGFFSADEFLQAATTFPAADYPWLPKSDAGNSLLEGYLYPDTYQLSAGAITPQTVLKQMLDRFQEIALPLYAEAQGKTSLSFAEWVTLASIVEKEAVVPSERAVIAGVFLNRLKQNMPLGADPTVEYGLGIKQTPDRPLTYAEVNTPSPYNTYINSGLPPTPIASPGQASLKATLFPDKTDYLYFVARYDGTHVFSRTLAEHQAAQDAIHDQREAQKPASPAAN